MLPFLLTEPGVHSFDYPYDADADLARPIDELVDEFQAYGVCAATKR
jgi:hypothetical protein